MQRRSMGLLVVLMDHLDQVDRVALEAREVGRVVDQVAGAVLVRVVVREAAQGQGVEVVQVEAAAVAVADQAVDRVDHQVRFHRQKVVLVLPLQAMELLKTMTVRRTNISV
jgi:hypothetical protein